jgi:hypothetical protein
VRVPLTPFPGGWVATPVALGEAVEAARLQPPRVTAVVAARAAMTRDGRERIL